MELLLVGWQKSQHQSAHVEQIPVLHRLRLRDGSPVEQNAVFGVEGVELPLTGVVPNQGGVTAGDSGEVEHHITPAGAADEVFPVGEGIGGLVCCNQIAPYLLLDLSSQQTASAADQDEQRQQGRQQLQQTGDGLHQLSCHVRIGHGLGQAVP